MIRVSADILQRFLAKVFVKAGLPKKDAATVADHLMFCNLRGVDSHGVTRVPDYLKRLKDGGTNARPKVKAIQNRSSAVLLDGDNGMGQVAGLCAADLAVRKAKKTGMCVVGVRGSSHYGAASYYSLRIAGSDMIGFSTTNVNPVMAAWGGSSRAIGNNPLSIAVPGLLNKSVVLDISMSIVAGGKIKLAKDGGQKIPKGWILDSRGRDSEDPGDFFKGGSLFPFGAHKGYGLAFMLEMLAGVLTGAAILDEIPIWFKETAAPVNIGHLFGAVDIGRFAGADFFKDRLHGMAAELKGRTLEGQAGAVCLPGEVEEKIESERRQNGVPLGEELWDELMKISASFGEPLRAAGGRG